MNEIITLRLLQREYLCEKFKRNDRDLFVSLIAKKKFLRISLREKCNTLLLLRII